MGWPWLAMLAVAPVHASTTLQAVSLSVPGVQLHKLDANLATGDDGQLQLTLDAARTDIPALGLRGAALHLEGQLRRVRADAWSCTGTIRLRGAPGGLLRRQQPFTLTVDIEANTLQIDLGPVKARIVSAALPLDQLSHVQAQLLQLPLAWLQGPLSQAWSGRLSSGTASGTVAMDFDDGGLKGSALLDLGNAGFDGGSVAAEKLGFKGRVNFVTDTSHSRTSLSGTLRGGQVLLGPLYAQLPGKAVRLGFDLTSRGGSMRLDRLRFSDPGALTLDGSMVFARDGNIHSLALSRFDARFPQAYRRYGRTWLATMGLRNMTTSGEISGSVRLGPQGLGVLRMQARDVNLADDAGRFRIRGLDGGLDWNRSGVRPDTRLAWKGLDMYRIPFGAGDSRWQSRDGTLQLEGPLSLKVLGGDLGIRRFAWHPDASKGDRIDVSSTLTGVDMGRLSHALGWPAFHGTLAGAMPALHYADGRMQLKGGLSLNVFGGFVDVTRLSLTHPFGDTPELAADLSLQRLDLGAVTDVFHFGKITGRMHGKVSNLHLVDWKPVGFKAQLLADSGGRISQRAVNNLTSVGGGGVASGLQGAVLRLFKNFSYARIGLSGTLEGNTCHMSGLKSSDGGYLIVEGRGLPHLTVIGHQRKVSWSTLVSRLREAIHSGGPVVSGS